MRDQLTTAQRRIGTCARVARRRVATEASRRLASLRTDTVEGDELAGLLFGQQHPGSRDFFTASVGQCHTVPLSALPHLAFARDPEEGRAVFEDYLEKSWAFIWPENNTPEARRLHIERFLERRELIERGERVERPTLVFRRRDGRYVIADGNHRAAIALALNRTCQAESPERWSLALGGCHHLRCVLRIGLPGDALSEPV